jgi:hypothetical protein
MTHTAHFLRDFDAVQHRQCAAIWTYRQSISLWPMLFAETEL